MKKIIINDYMLKDEDIEKEVERVKGLVINSDNKILLAFNNNTYQFLGGHLEKNEKKEICLQREIKEEAGIDVEVEDNPFLNIITYDNNYFDTGIKVKNSIYYYRIICDKMPDFSNTKYDELEIKSDFNLIYVNFFELENFIKNNLKNGLIDENIGREMLYALEVYNNVYGG